MRRKRQEREEREEVLKQPDMRDVVLPAHLLEGKLRLSIKLEELREKEVPMVTVHGEPRLMIAAVAQA